MNANNKIFLSISLLVLAISSIASAAYIPASGPLKLIDSFGQDPKNPWGPPIIHRGVITAELLKNPALANERGAVYNFMGILPPTTLPFYQDIVQALETSTDQYSSIQAIKAFEKTIMSLVYYEEYLYTFDNKVMNLALIGIRKPSSILQYSNKSYQLLDELKNLAKIANRHDIAYSLQLQARANAYIHSLKITVSTAIATYLAYNNREAIQKYIKDNTARILSSGYNTIARGLGDVYNTGINTLGSGYNAITNELGSTYKAGADALGSSYNAIASGLGDIYNTGANTLGSMYNYGAESLGSAYQTGLNSLNDTASTFSNQLNALKNTQINPTLAAAAGGALGGFSGGYLAGTYNNNQTEQ